MGDIRHWVDHGNTEMKLLLRCDIPLIVYKNVIMFLRPDLCVSKVMGEKPKNLN